MDKAKDYIIIAVLIAVLGIAAYLFLKKDKDTITREDFQRYLAIQDSNVSLRVERGILQQQIKDINRSFDSVIASIPQIKKNLIYSKEAYKKLSINEKDEYFLKLYNIK